MFALSSISLFVTVLISSTTASPASSFDAPTVWTDAKSNCFNCPDGHKSKWTGPHGGKWGIMCGTDTASTTYYKGPFYGKTWEECILECGKNYDWCKIATWMGGNGEGGTCYLKMSSKGLGYTKAQPNFRTAIKLS